MANQKLRLDRTLGPLVVSWIEKYLVHGPGDVQGQTVQLDDEQTRFILRAYEINDKGHRVVRRAVYSRSKGRAKSEFAAMLVCAEALGPVRFNGWGQNGRPLGRPVLSPFIPCVATEEQQADNVYANVRFMLTEGAAVGIPGLDVGMTRTFVPGGGKIKPISAKASSKDGGKETFASFDEPLALDTPIPTPSGWKKMGDLVVGDLVFGLDGSPVLVWGVAPIKRGRPCYKVTFDDGDSIVSDASHRWIAFDRKSKHKWVETTTEEMATANWYGANRFAVAQPSPLHLPESALSIDPYLFGLWLGDGDSSVATISVGRMDLAHVEKEMELVGTESRVYDYDCERGAVSVRFNQGTKWSKKDSSETQLHRLGVIGRKHVPHQFLWASVDQRLALLQGLMDSDGYAGKGGNCVFTNKSRELADAVVFLVRSLGWRASAGHWSSDERWKNETGIWRVSFTPYGMVPFRLSRKASRCRQSLEEKTRAIVSIKQVDSVPVRCIAVDSDDHLFLAGDSMLPTHNTHLYITPELRRLIETIRRNLAKRKAAEPWSLETSTMYAPGEDSVAERSHLYAEQVASGKLNDPTFLFDHRQGPPRFDFEDDDQLRAALRDAYGEAAEWMDVERLILEARDPDTDRSDFMRYFINVPIERTQGRWIQDEIWRSCYGETAIPPKASIAVGVDAAHTRDTTACVWSWRDPATNRIVQRSRVWSCILDKPNDVFVAGGRLDNDLVRDFIRDELLPQFTVKLVLGDERYFADQLHELADQDGLLVIEMHQGQQEMQAAWDEFYGLVHEGSIPTIEHNGDPVYAAHVRNTVGVKGARGWKVSKAAARLPIDAVAAAAMSAFGVTHMDELVPPTSHEPMFAWA